MGPRRKTRNKGTAASSPVTAAVEQVVTDEGAKQQVVTEVQGLAATFNAEMTAKRNEFQLDDEDYKPTLFNAEPGINLFYRTGNLINLERTLARHLENIEQEVEEQNDAPKNENLSYFQQFCQWLSSAINALLKNLNQLFSSIRSMLFPVEEPAAAEKPGVVAKSAAKHQPSTPFFDERKAAQRFFAGKPKRTPSQSDENKAGHDVHNAESSSSAAIKPQ